MERTNSKFGNITRIASGYRGSGVFCESYEIWKQRPGWLGTSLRDPRFMTRGGLEDSSPTTPGEVLKPPLRIYGAIIGMSETVDARREASWSEF